VDRDERSDARGTSEVRTSLRQNTLNTRIIMYYHFSVDKNVHLNNRNITSKNSFKLNSALYTSLLCIVTTLIGLLRKNFSGLHYLCSSFALFLIYLFFSFLFLCLGKRIT
jgi:hypothetical protein